ncbi:MAG TPA: hypothetical protein PK544_05975 [Spirochaetota bacterium]|nr:hypothetical protein [Spirochaetota bacterium]HPJ36953.1 hypothetical protein [Spirochaetota bacterium]
MKPSIAVLTLIVTLFIVSPQLYGGDTQEKPVAVVSGQFEKIDRILTHYGIPFTAIKYRDLANPATLKAYRAVFFPCGVRKPVEQSITVSARGYSIRNVSLKGKLFTINKKKVFQNIESFIAQGGTAYFSDYSYFLIQGAFKALTFFDDFPNMGLSGTFNATLKGSLKKFVSRDVIQVTIPHSGWVALKEFRGSKTLAQCTYDTVRGRKSGPLISLARHGSGTMMFTSFHTDDYNNLITRYMVFRTAYSNYIQKIRDEIFRWEQNEEFVTSDAVLIREYSRRYAITLKTGNNTVYLHAPGGSYQVDVFSENGSLLFSRDGIAGPEPIDIGSREDIRCFLYIYPSPSSHMQAFAVGVASGARLIPHQSRIFYGIILIFALTITVLLLKMLNPRRLSGRLYKTFDRFKNEN